MERYNAVSAQGAKAQEALGEAFDHATAAGKSTTEAMEEAVAAYEQLTAASTAAAASQREVAASMNSGASGTLAANGAMRVLEGSMMGGTRAAASFLSNTLGLGPVLEAAFPVIGAAALGMVIVDVAKEITKFSQNAEDLANELGTDWMTGAIGQMDGLADAVKDADKEVEALNKDLDQTRNRGQQAAIENIRLTQGPAAAYRAEAANDKTQEIANEKALNLLLEERSRLTKETQFGAHPEMTPGAEIKARLEATKQLEVVNKQIADYQATDNVLLQEAANLEIQAAQVKEKVAKPKKMPRSEAFDEWLMSYRIGEEESKRITESITAEWERGQKAEQEATRKADEADRRAVEDWKKRHEEQMRMIAEQAQAEMRAAEESASAADEQIAHQEKMGQISGPAAAQKRIDVSNQEQADKINALGAQLDATDRITEPAQYQRIQDQITDIQRKGAQQRQQIADQEAERQYRTQTQMFDKIYAPLQQFTDTWLTSNRNMGEAAARMADQMALSVINALMRIAAQELIGMALHKTIGKEERLDDAKGAFAGTYKAISGIPFVGPFLAPPMAAAAFAAVAAFDKGVDYVPRDGMAMLHEGEPVGTKAEGSKISQLINIAQSGMKGSGETHMHYSPTISGIDGASVEGMARQHGNAFFRQAARQMRLMGRAQ